VGGFLRNYFSGLPTANTDIDLCADAKVEELNVPYKTQSKKLGTALVNICGREYEYTPFRKESYVGGNHTPSSVILGAKIEEDAKRRDFTVGCIYYCLSDNTVYDPYDGISDAKNRVIRHINNEVFGSDGLRLLRMVRIAAQTGFKIEESTLNSAKKQAKLLSDISPERKREELLQMLSADQIYGAEDGHYKALVYTEEAGLFEYFIPEIVLMRGFEQNPLYHKYDVMWHTFHTVRHAHPRVRVAALFHDIAKPLCKLRDGNMHLHALEGSHLTRKIMTDLRFSNKEIERTVRLVRHHMFDLKGETSFNKVKLFVADNMDIIDDLMLLNRADALGTGKHDTDLHRFRQAKEEILSTLAPYDLSMLKIKGSDLKDLGYSGKEIRLKLEELQRICVLNPALNNFEWLIATAKNHLKVGYRLYK